MSCNESESKREEEEKGEDTDADTDLITTKRMTRDKSTNHY